jgi:hypothetical protein
MSDRELSTRDLAERPETTSDAPAGNDHDASDQDLGKPTADAGPSGQPDPASEPLTRERTADEAPANSSVDADSARAESDETPHEQEPLLTEDQTVGFTTRWREIQVGFVDEPRESVAQADTLVADLMQQLAASFSDERERLERQWDSGDNVSTEDLRVALTRYRSFFDRLLSA